MIKLALQQLFTLALDQLELPPCEFSFEVPRDSAHGDYATNIAMQLAGRTGSSPRDLAERIIEMVKTIDSARDFSLVASCNVAGPGFINVVLADSVLLWELSSVLEYGDRYGSDAMGKGKTVTIDYFQPNIAKPLHIGHLRSAVIGDSVKRTLLFLGYDVIGDSHIGDWGFQFGLLVYAYRQWGVKEDIEKEPIDELVALYVHAHKEMKVNPEIRDLAKEEFCKIEDGDEENRKLWQWFVDVTLKQLKHVRKEFALLPFEQDLGESFYEPRLQSDLDALKTKGLVEAGDDGELYVDLEEEKLGRFVLVNSHGATLYALRDVSAYLHRLEEWNVDHNLYVVDARQGFYFKQLFATMKKAGYAELDRASHVSFGIMSSPTGAFSTREGNHVRLTDVLSELEKKAGEVIEEKNPDLKDTSTVARQIALGALKFQDLSHDRTSDIVFSLDEAMSFEGKTGPYLQYSYARVQSILRKLDMDAYELGEIEFNVELDEYSRALLVMLQRFSSVVQLSAREHKPHIIAEFAFELAQVMNTFYAHCPVAKEEDKELQNFRAALLAAAAQVLKNGLALLGIDTPSEM